MSAQPIRTAIIGTGFMGWVHCEALRRVGVNVVGILGSSLAKSKAASEQLKIEVAYESLEQICNDPSVQSVHVVTPNHLHAEQVTRLIQAGKHVLCEKPLAMNATESRQLIELAARHPELSTAVNYNIRFYPLCQEAKARIAAGQLGRLFHVTGSYQQDWLLHETDFNWRVATDQGGALRAVSDIGTHWLDLIQFISGSKVKAVMAELKTVHPVRFQPTSVGETFQGNEVDPQQAADASEAIEIETDDCAAIMLKLEQGAIGQLFVSQVAAGCKNSLRFGIAGSRTSLQWDSEHPNSIWIGHRDRSNESLLRDPALLSPLAQQATSYPGGHNEGYDDSFKHCFQAFYDDVRHRINGDWKVESARLPVIPSFEDGHREILLCEAILKSHQDRAWVEVDFKGEG